MSDDFETEDKPRTKPKSKAPMDYVTSTIDAIKEDLPGWRFVAGVPGTDGNIVRVTAHGGQIRKAQKVNGKWKLV